jgi:hypothetical protein
MAVLVKKEDSHGSFGGKGRRAMAAWSEGGGGESHGSSGNGERRARGVLM